MAVNTPPELEDVQTDCSISFVQCSAQPVTLSVGFQGPAPLRLSFRYKPLSDHDFASQREEAALLCWAAAISPWFSSDVFVFLQ